MTEVRKIFIDAFPTSMSKEVGSLLDKIILTTEFNSTSFYKVLLDDQVLEIPDRIYYEFPIQFHLTANEKFILNCIFTRHHSGFMREKCLKEILKSDNIISIPFIVTLIGEYVIEILTTINDNLTPALTDRIIKFKTENIEFFKIIEYRIQSYWDCYYKMKSMKKADYPGFQIISTIRKREELLELNNIT